MAEIEVAATSPSPAANPPTIYRLSVERFRGIEALSWQPARGANRHSGRRRRRQDHTSSKPSASFSARQTPSTFPIPTIHAQRRGGIRHRGRFHCRRTSGIIDSSSLLAVGMERHGRRCAQRRRENRRKASLFTSARVRGTEDLELAYEIVQPDGTPTCCLLRCAGPLALCALAATTAVTATSASCRARRSTGCCRTSPCAHGSQANSPTPTSRINSPPTPKKALEDLDDVFERGEAAGLPRTLGHRQSRRVHRLDDWPDRRPQRRQLPLASWGRVRQAVARSRSQRRTRASIPSPSSTKSSAGSSRTASACSSASCKREVAGVHHDAQPCSDFSAASGTRSGTSHTTERSVPSTTRRSPHHREKDPDTFLSRLAIICEGVTEVGFCRALLERALERRFDQHGIHVSDGNGQ